MKTNISVYALLMHSASKPKPNSTVRLSREVITCAASTLEKRLEDVKHFLKTISPSITLKSDASDIMSFDLKFELEERDVMEILELPEKIASAKGIQLIVCIDEFQQLALLPDYKSMEGKMQLCLAATAAGSLLFLWEQAAHDDGHFQQFVQSLLSFRASTVPTKD